MSSLDWLLDGERHDFVVPKLPSFVAADEFWDGTIERVELGRSLRVYLNDVRIRRDLRARSMVDRPGEYLVGQVTIAGRAEIDLHDGVVARTDCNRAVLFRGDGRPGVFAFKAGTRYFSVGYALTPERIEGLLDGRVPDTLQGMLAPDASRSRVFTSAADKFVRSVARGLFSNKLNGPLRCLALEGGVMQLVAAQAASPTPVCGAALSAAERRAILRARERLLADMRRAPLLSELAAEVGLSEKRLNAGFRETFGETVFEVLRNERLEHARKALEERVLSLKEIAFRVGYNHVTNFVHAFTARYGAPPSRYLARKRSRRR